MEIKKTEISTHLHQKELPETKLPKTKWLKNKWSFSDSFHLKVYLVLGLALVLVIAFNLAQGASFKTLFEQRLAEAKEAAVPAKIQLVVIKNSGCRDCFDIGPITASLKEANVNITEERVLEFDSKIAKELIEKYGLEKIPLLLVSGEIDKLNIRDLERGDGVLIFTKQTPPYTDAKTGEVRGRVTTFLLKDSSCNQCNDLGQIPATLRQSGIFIKEQKTLESSSPKAQELIRRMNITRLPAFLISNDINVYSFVEKIKQSGMVEKEGYYLVESLAPYVEVQTGKIRGLVDLTLITDQACASCYDVKLHKQIFAQMGLALEKEKTVDINSVEGIRLKAKYNLEKVPTVVLSGDLDAYTGFDQVWNQVGTIEEDGVYLFRNIELLGPAIVYRNLKNGSVMGAASPAVSLN